MAACVITCWTRDLRDIAQITLPEMQRYCTKHGFDINFSELDSGDRGYVKTKPIIDALQSNYDYIIWIDIDILIVGENNILDDINHKHDIYMSWHFNDKFIVPHYNTGVMIIRNTEWSRRLFIEISEIGKQKLIDHAWSDQAALLHLLGYNNIIEYGSKIDETGNKNRKYVAELDWNFNSIIGVCVGDDPQFHHYAGTNRRYRKHILEIDHKFFKHFRNGDPICRKAYTHILGEMRAMFEANIALQDTSKASQELVQLVCDSTSWKITKPLRAVGAIAKKLMKLTARG